MCLYGQHCANRLLLLLRFQTVQHGFPNKPTALAWDPSLRLMIIGTASGAIKVYPFVFLVLCAPILALRPVFIIRSRGNRVSRDSMTFVYRSINSRKTPSFSRKRKLCEAPIVE